YPPMASLRIPGATLALLSLLLLLAALGSDHWLVASSHLVSSYSGLPSCSQPPGPRAQGFLYPLTSPVEPPSCCGLWLFPSGGMGQGPWTAQRMRLCAMIAMAVYTAEFAEALYLTQGQVSFGWSFSLGWAAFPLFLITGECNREEYQNAAISGVRHRGYLYRDPLLSAEV
uniref:Uncharacterized protein n=1 Tax=Pelusios castaneus TaxID=367368 RepID=A0A8C8RPB6_9SAUR